MKVSSFQGLRRGELTSRHNVLAIQKPWIKNFEVCFKQWHFNTIKFRIMSQGQKFKCSFYSKFFITNTETSYWKILHIKINHVNYISAKKWYARFYQSKYAIMSDRDILFFFIFKIGDWSLNNRFISRDFFNN